MNPPSPTKDKHFNKKLLITSPFWQAKLDLLSNSTAIRMVEDLDPGGPLGIGNGDLSFWKGFKHTYGKKDSNVDFLLRIKNQHPEKIVLVQIGEFYESWGIDSVFLVEHCGLNRMGRGGPRAGTPLGNIQSILDHLTQAGFAVVICEQANHTTKSGRKIRFIAEIVTPSSCVYTYGLAMDKRRGNTNFPDCPPEFGLAFDKRGVILVEINPDLRTVLIQEGLTKEAAEMRLSRYGGRMNRIICHESIDKEFLETCHLHSEHIVNVSGYLPKNFPARVEELVKIDLSLDSDVVFTHIHPQIARTEMIPRALYLGTAQQIGLLPHPGIPNLMEHMLPKGSPMTCQNVLRNLLLNPPPVSIADQVRKVLQTMMSEKISLPEFPVSNPARYIKTVHKREASPEILKDLFDIAGSFSQCYQTPLSVRMPNVLAVVAHMLNMGIGEKTLQESSQFISELLLPILPKDEDTPYIPKHEMVSRHLFEHIEDGFRGRVARTSHPGIKRLYGLVEAAAASYEKALKKELIPLVEERSRKRGKNKKLKPLALSFDLHNQAIWLRGSIQHQELLHPVDRHGKEVKDRWTTQNVEQKLKTYKDTVEKTRLAVFELLKDISRQLAGHSLPILHLATFSNLLRTLCLHLRGCRPKGWGLKVQAHSKSEHRLELNGFFPYWMSPHQAVKNSLSLNGMSILTGHNMAGKSTTLRSSAVVTLLASSGLMFPAQEMHMREAIDGWFLRTSTHDDPQSGLSAFAVEMVDIKTALREATTNSFMLIDELGKGTESRAGHALAGSILEHLQAHHIRGIFSTHWHELFFNPSLNLDSIEEIKMEIKRGRPIYKVVPGRCLTSFAFEAALEIGVDQTLIDRAQEVAKGYPLQVNQAKTVLYSLPKLRRAPSLAEPSADYGKYTLERAGRILKDITGNPSTAIRILKSRAYPFLKDVNSSVLYIIRTQQGFFYVGETDDIHSRFTVHCQDEAKKEGQWLYTLIPQGKSAARKFETQLILKLKALGYPLLSTQDAQHGHFGAGDI